MSKKWTGERLESHIYNRNTIDHLHRYAIAAEYCEGKTVLDIASGEGYGSNLLSMRAAFVHGVDIDAETIRAAQVKYRKPNLEFRAGSADSIPLTDNSVDVVVSFETIEHHDRHEEMMSEIRRVIKPGGTVIISTPDKLHYTDNRNFHNEFHVKELYKHEFADLISRHFPNIQMLNQTYVNGNSLIADDTSAAVTYYTGDYTAVGPAERPPFYLLAIASDAPVRKQPDSVFDGGLIKDIENQSLISSNTLFHKIGRKLPHPIRKLINSLR